MLWKEIRSYEIVWGRVQNEEENQHSQKRSQWNKKRVSPETFKNKYFIQNQYEKEARRISKESRWVCCLFLSATPNKCWWVHVSASICCLLHYISAYGKKLSVINFGNIWSIINLQREETASLEILATCTRRKLKKVRRGECEKWGWTKRSGMGGFNVSKVGRVRGVNKFAMDTFNDG